jgi:hypothetical protein
LLNYCKRVELGEAKKKPFSVLDALINNEPHEQLTPVRRKQLNTMWSGRLETLKTALQSLVDPAYPDQEAYGIAVRQAADALGCQVKHIYRLMRIFQIDRQPFATTVTRKQASKAKNKRQENLRAQALRAISGTVPVTGVAEDLPCSTRTLRRYIDDALAFHPGILISTLNRYPSAFRRSVAWEIEHNDRALTSLKIKKVYDTWGKPHAYVQPADLRHARYRHKLIAVLDGQYSMQQMVTLADTAQEVLERAFESEVQALGLGWSEITKSRHHMAFVAEILKG